jgi:prolyl-tRNA synthetase
MTLPMGLRVLDKIERLVDLAMAECGGNKLSMPLMLPSALWKRTGRWDTAGEELVRLQDRKGNDYCLAPTHEEAFTELVSSSITSWRQLEPHGLRLYQVGNKYRDEMRPRFGLMRSREFVMKDMYSFDVDEAASRRTYGDVSRSYGALCHAIFGQEG